MLPGDIATSTPVTHGYTFTTAPNYYEPLWTDHCDPNIPVSDFDIDMREDEDSPCQASASIVDDDPAFNNSIRDKAIFFKVESMSRASLFDYVDSYIADNPPSNPEALLLTITAQPSLLVRPMLAGTPPRLHSWPADHAMYRFYGAAFDSLTTSFSPFNEATSMTEMQ